MTRHVRARGAAVLPLLLPILLVACTAAGQPGSGAQSTAGGSAAGSVAPTGGQVRKDASGIEQVWVPAGAFEMGSDDATVQALQSQEPIAFVIAELPMEQPQHEVRLSKGYWIDKYEVTNESFQAFVDAGGYKNRGFWSDAGWEWLAGRDAGEVRTYCLGNDVPTNPVACVSWYEAEAYAAWRGGRLPTEAEWEYAARGPESHVYPWGGEFDPAKANVLESAGTKPVGSYPAGASWVGALDMSGNVMEWVADWSGPYAAGAATDPTGPATGDLKIEKGGWWGSSAIIARSAYRHIEDPPSYGDLHIGFRIVSPG